MLKLTDMYQSFINAFFGQLKRGRLSLMQRDRMISHKHTMQHTEDWLLYLVQPHSLKSSECKKLFNASVIKTIIWVN